MWTCEGARLRIKDLPMHLKNSGWKADHPSPETKESTRISSQKTLALTNNSNIKMGGLHGIFLSERKSCDTVLYTCFSWILELARTLESCQPRDAAAGPVPTVLIFTLSSNLRPPPRRDITPPYRLRLLAIGARAQRQPKGIFLTSLGFRTWMSNIDDLL